MSMEGRKTLDKRTSQLCAVGKSRARYQKNQLFIGVLFIISIFYATTVLQTAFTAQQTQYKTGNNDICYYNSRCQIPLHYNTTLPRYFLDFNHFFSNLGYVVFGFTFIGIVYMKSRRYNEGADNEKELASTRGIPYLTGVYYSLGGALVMEGLMSAAYHICPTTISFQFDTTFMYLIAILIYVKLYQNRHPDSSASSVQVYIVLGVAIMLEAMSIRMPSTEFVVIFCIIYVLGIICVVANIYQLDSKDGCRNEKEHSSLFDRITFIRVYRTLIGECLSCTVNKTKGEFKFETPRPLLVFICVISVFNILMSVYLGVNVSSGNHNVSEFLLYHFMTNMIIYFVYYLIMKLINKECPTLRTWCYLGGFSCFFFFHFGLFDSNVAALCFACGVPAYNFFRHHEKDSNLSPAESRELNTACQIFKFYDG